MAIEIPSKRIYEIDNPKVIDNEVDKVEYSESDVLPDNKTREVVFSQTFSVDELYEEDAIETVPLYNEDYKDGVSITPYRIGAACELYAIYAKIPTIIIPKLTGTSFIKLPYTGEGDIEISTPFTYDAYSGVPITSSNGKIVFPSTGGSQYHGFPKDILDYEEVGNDIDYTHIPNWDSGNRVNLQFSFSKNTGEGGSFILHALYSGGISISQTANARITYAVDKSMPDFVLTDTPDHYEIKGVRVFCGLTAKAGIVYGGQDLTNIVGSEAILAFLNCKGIEINIYADTVGVSFSEKQKSIGSGLHVYSKQANELIQESNLRNAGNFTISVGKLIVDQGNFSLYALILPEGRTVDDGTFFQYQGETCVVQSVNGQQAIRCLKNGRVASLSGVPASFVVNMFIKDATERTIQKIIDSYRQGKETATIRCMVHDYFSTETERTDFTGQIGGITESLDPRLTNITVYTQKRDLSQATEIWVKTNADSSNSRWVRTVYSREIATGIWALRADAPSTEFAIGDISIYYYSKPLVISPYTSSVGKMTFAIGDEVIPYVRGANGRDKAMSLYKSGEPKRFKVVDKKMIDDGIVVQEITIQEITQ